MTTTAVFCCVVLAGGPFDVAGGLPIGAVVTLPDSAPTHDERETSPMLEMLGGTLVHLDKREAAQLRTCAGAVAAPASATKRYFTVHLFAAGKADSPRPVEILRDTRGEWFARPLPDPNAKVQSKGAAEVIALDRDKFAAFAAGWPKFQGKFEVDRVQTPAGRVGQLADPSPGWWTMDKYTLGERFLAGRPTTIDGADRVLSENKFKLRLPKNYEARERCGVLVWVDPSETTSLHECLWAAADELRLIVIGAEKTGNDVPAANRDQMALDAAQSVQERFLCDPDRIYVSGMSGGGRITSQLWACFPDVFTGAVPIVGLDCYEVASAGGGMVHRAGYAKPPGKVWKLLTHHRLGVMSGPQDFNFSEITKFAAIYKRDKIDIHVYEYADMAHQLPTSARFAEAMSWVDEPVRTRRDEDAAKAQLLVDKADATRADLVAATSLAPWSKAAWAAAVKLGVAAAAAPAEKK